jgi:hypothetical protein
MTENKSAIAIDSNPHIDPCLIYLNSMVINDSSIDAEFSFYITLMLQGTIVSGKLISDNLYFSSVTNTISSRLQSRIINDLFEDYRAMFTENRFDILFLHLQNVVIRQTNKSQNIELELMRIPLASVGGFSIATL